MKLEINVEKDLAVYIHAPSPDPIIARNYWLVQLNDLQIAFNCNYGPMKAWHWTGTGLTLQQAYDKAISNMHQELHRVGSIVRKPGGLADLFGR